MTSQIFFTVLSGAMVFTIGQILQKFLLEPIQEYKKTVGKIDNRLKFYDNILTNAVFDKKIIIEITNAMRNLSCNLEANYKQIPFNKLLINLKLLEPKEDIAKAARELIFLSNAGGRNNNDIEICDKKIKDIRKRLKIKPLNE